MEKLNLEYSVHDGSLERWTDTKSGRVVKERIEYQSFTEEFFYDDKGCIHSFNDEPSAITTYKSGAKIFSWKSHGLLHRQDGPAFIDSDGVQHWYMHNVRARVDDLPTEVYPNGLEIWRACDDYLFTTRPRTYVAMRNGVPGYLNEFQIEFTDGSVVRLNDRHEIHACGEPAIVWADGTREWYEYRWKCDEPSN